MSRHEQSILFAKLFRKYYPRGTNLVTILHDSRQPFKSLLTIRNILEYMVMENILLKIPLSMKGPGQGVPNLYVLSDDFEIPENICDSCGQVVPEEEL